MLDASLSAATGWDSGKLSSTSVLLSDRGKDEDGFCVAKRALRRGRAGWLEAISGEVVAGGDGFEGVEVGFWVVTAVSCTSFASEGIVQESSSVCEENCWNEVGERILRCRPQVVTWMLRKPAALTEVQSRSSLDYIGRQTASLLRVA